MTDKIKEALEREIIRVEKRNTRTAYSPIWNEAVKTMASDIIDTLPAALSTPAAKREEGERLTAEDAAKIFFMGCAEEASGTR